MTKTIVATLMLIVGILGLSFGIALAASGLTYLIIGFALYVAQVEFARMFVSLSLGLWLVVIATAMMSILNKGEEYIWETFCEENNDIR